MADGVLSIKVEEEDVINRTLSGLSIRTPKHKKTDPLSAPIVPGITKNKSPFPDVHSPYSHGKTETEGGSEGLKSPIGRISPTFEGGYEEDDIMIFRMNKEQRILFNMWKKEFKEREVYHFTFTFIPKNHYEFNIKIEHISGAKIEI